MGTVNLGWKPLIKALILGRASSCKVQASFFTLWCFVVWGSFTLNYLVGISGADLCQKECTSIWKRMWERVSLNERKCSWCTDKFLVFSLEYSYAVTELRRNCCYVEELFHWHFFCKNSKKGMLKWLITDIICSRVKVVNLRMGLVT